MTRRAVSVVASAALGLAVSAMLAACGQKGPLVLAKPAPPAAAPALPTPTTVTPALSPASAPVPR